MKPAIKKTKSSSCDIDMVLPCLRKTPIDRIIPSPGELLFNGKLVCNFPLKYANHNTLRDKLDITAYYDQHTEGLPDIQIGQRVKIHNKEAS